VTSPAIHSSSASPQAEASRARQDLAVAAAYAFLVPFLALTVCGVAVVLGVRGYELAMIGMAMFTTVVAFIPVAGQRLIHPDRRRLYISFLTLTFLIYFALPIFTQYFWAVEDSLSHTALYNIDPEEILMGQTAALVALVCLIVGFALPLGPLITSFFPVPRHEWGHQNTLIISTGMIVVGWVLFLSGRMGLGLVPTRLGSGFLGSITSSYYFGIALLTIAYIKFRSRPALLLLFVFLPLSTLFGFLTGSKRLFLAPAAMVAIAHMVVTRKARIYWFILAALGISVIYPIAQFYRMTVQMGNTLSIPEVLANPGRAALLLSTFIASVDPGDYLLAGLDATAGRLSALGILTVIVNSTPDLVPFQGGWTLAMVPISFIPRAIWPDKPATTIGLWVTETYGSGPGIISATGPSQVGELYFSYGWPGIIFGWLLLGIYFRGISELFFRADAPTVSLLTAVIALWTTLPGLQGTLLNFTTGFVFTALYIVLLHLLVRVFMGTTVPGRAPPPSHASPLQ